LFARNRGALTRCATCSVPVSKAFQLKRATARHYGPKVKSGFQRLNVGCVHREPLSESGIAQGELSMPTFQPQGQNTVTPRIVVTDPKSLVEFLRSVFDAEGEFKTGMPSEIRIGDSIVMVSDGGGLRGASCAFLYVYVENTDATYLRAQVAGAMTLEEPAEMPYGDRRATVRDPWGNIWQIATHRPGA
jgi:PhnB protein